jgi:hypothetical protein
MDECFDYPLDLPTIFDTMDDNENEDRIDSEEEHEAEDPKDSSCMESNIKEKDDNQSTEKIIDVESSQDGSRIEEHSNEEQKEMQQLKKVAVNSDVQQKSDIEQDTEPQVPERFEITILRKEWDKVCEYRTRKFTLQAVGKHPARDIESRDYSLKRDDYGVPIKKGFAVHNPYCSLHFGKKNVLPDHKTETGAAQIRIYTNCTRTGCTATWSFTCSRIPRDGDVNFLVR